MEQFDQTHLEEEQRAQRATIFRVYNYYRIGIAFLFLFFFVNPELNEFVGAVNPELFQQTIITYIIVNVLIGIATLFVNVRFLSQPPVAVVVIIADIIALTVLLSASGGVSSGLGNFLFFTLAFAGGLVHGRISLVLPAIAFILILYDEFYLFFLDENDLQSFFQAGLLGIVYFVTNILFQTLSQQLRTRQSEVYTLEQINQQIIERMRIGIMVLTEGNKPRHMNQAAERLLTTSDLKTPVRDAVPSVLLDAVAQWKADPLNREVSFSTGPSGIDVIASFSLLNTPSKDADTLIFLEDSSEAQRQAQQLKLASLGRLSASIAHEIRNPLGAISHAAQLLRESENLDRGDERLCEIVQDHSIRMNDVIENVLQLSRRRAPEIARIDLQQWVREFVSDFTVSEGSADIKVDIPGDLIVMMDPLHLTQVMSNLCQNGIRYSQKKTGESKLLIRAAIDDLLETPYLEVIDYGEGVSDENQESLFEPFYTTESKGTGLGLYLSRELCAANDARLSYLSASTGGSAFRIGFRSETRITHE